MDRNDPFKPNTLVLFGPPGCGKSTLVLAAQKMGLSAVDLEKEPRLKGQLALLRSYRLVGAADTQPEHYAHAGFTRVLLLPSERIYRWRRMERDRLHPHKANQGDHYPGFKARSHRFDFIPAFASDGRLLSISEMLGRLLSYP